VRKSGGGFAHHSFRQPVPPHFAHHNFDAIPLNDIAAPRRSSAPVGRARQTFEDVSKLPRSRQTKILDVVDALIKALFSKHWKTTSSFSEPWTLLFQGLETTALWVACSDRSAAHEGRNTAQP
jgi:hypothetical protein